MPSRKTSKSRSPRKKTKSTPVPQVQDEQKDKKAPHQKVTDVIGINLSVSRVRRYIDKYNINADVETACSEVRACCEQEKNNSEVSPLSEPTLALVDRAYETVWSVKKSKYDTLKARLTASKTRADAKRLKNLEPFPDKTDTLKEKLEYVSKLRYRFSNDAAVALAAALDFTVQELVRTAMVNAYTNGKAIIQVEHILQGNFHSLISYPLVAPLQAVQHGMRANTEEEQGDSDDEEHTGATFEFYVSQICKAVKSKLVSEDSSYSCIRVSKGIRKFCSDVVIQLIKRVAPLVTLYSDSSKVKTVNDDVIMFVLKFLLLDASNEYDVFCKYVQNCLRLYHESKN